MILIKRHTTAQLPERRFDFLAGRSTTSTGFSEYKDTK